MDPSRPASNPRRLELAPAAECGAKGALVVEAGTVKRRNVNLDERVDDKIVVLQGVEEGEKIIVRGLQQVRPGQPVKIRQMPPYES